MKWSAGLGIALLWGWGALAAAAELHLYAGAGLREPVEAVVSAFEKQSGHRVTVEYGGSGQLLTRINLTHAGDLFLPGSADYVERLRAQGRVSFSAPLVLHTPVMVVRRDTGAQVETLAQLAQSPLRIGMGDPHAIALGRSGDALLEASGYGQALRSRVVVQATTIKQLLLYVLNGDVDAAVIGRADAMRHRDRLRLLPTPPGVPQEVATIAVLQGSDQAAAARALAEYFASPQGIRAFTDRGYLPLAK
ncbi:molybdate ABC transporter substrate-binding protein [Edwardsiella piscicida]|uniref:molybdate ABC transporter substrate-binding protein n=1 Tax=Edwardsiella piscicida TaxID=1263550 RepID=UPI00054CB677|nr:molybdate ABC transporter substrate-binding protein [Edwardsiella piscicida]AOP42371.1 molybdate ABC transporter substrate-binding protein [Edwardsiella piscicida]EKS7765407.1 molybdate ABC transporter substrate-binding protein [Edwardsiella piscicida]EKS7778699.1 molybdate ABC transporter substrate-binding protein [Edwardsiella piscicida]EKS7782119.1 molybdate ABC transporter substrate-binding protein [Edwardsiella piscicida]EKS7792166.1 molybdate ABC transporter substrate-binding protein 